jgi:hypothetical protein
MHLGEERRAEGRPPPTVDLGSPLNLCAEGEEGKRTIDLMKKEKVERGRKEGETEMNQSPMICEATEEVIHLQRIYIFLLFHAIILSILDALYAII